MMIRKWSHQLAMTIILLDFILVACSPKQEKQGTTPSFEIQSATPTELASITNTPPSVPITQYDEAPILHEQVLAGTLPPVEERLPKNPRVIPVYDEIGQYGGTWHRAYTGLGDRFGPTKLIEERIVEFYMPDAETLLIVPNWADQFEANADSSQYTVHIREGLRWSDGMEVTTEDVRFWYEDVLLNEEFFSSLPNMLTVNGEPVKVEIIDKYTFKFIFGGSYPLFPTLVARSTPGAVGLQGDSFILPFHYLKNFHPTYTSEETLAALAESYDVASWLDLWGEGPVQAWWLNPDLPVLGAWKIKISPPADEIVMERNPYYHAIDAAGNQLPYIDKIVHNFAEDGDVVALWAIQGLIDLQNRHISAGSFDLLKRNEEAGDYRVVEWTSALTVALFPNLNTPDTVLASLFEDIRFRHALSISINRAELVTIITNGLGTIRQASPLYGSPQYDAEFAQKWTEYDPETANDLLDEIGLTERDTGGFRLRADGQTLAITILTTGSETLLDYIQSYWGDIGIKVNIEILDRLDYETRARAGEVEVGLWDFDRNVVIAADPGRYLGTTTDGPWAPLYAQWYLTNGESGMKPPPNHPIWLVWQAWDNALVAPNLIEAEIYIQEMVSIHKENIWVIGLFGEGPRLYIVHNNIRNFPENFVHEGSLRDIGLAMPVQFFFSSP